ncbi:MAG: biotin transporter BioY [Spirochaetales bacterium]
MIQTYDRTGTRAADITTDALVVITASVAIALLAQLSVPLWPVPITGQTLGVMAIAFLLGQKRGVVAVALYLTYGALGLPVFANGSAGAGIFLGPTGGYLIGFLLAAVIVGSVADWQTKRNDRPDTRGSEWIAILTLAAAFFVGTLVIYATGVAHLAGFVGWDDAVRVGVAPFLVGDALKLAILVTAAAAVPRRDSTESS